MYMYICIICIPHYTTAVCYMYNVHVYMLCVSREVEVGRDVFYCCVCACPPRDMEKIRKKAPESEGGQPAGKRKRKRSTLYIRVQCTWSTLIVSSSNQFEQYLTA